MIKEIRVGDLYINKSDGCSKGELILVYKNENNEYGNIIIKSKDGGIGTVGPCYGLSLDIYIRNYCKYLGNFIDIFEKIKTDE